MKERWRRAGAILSHPIFLNSGSRMTILQLFL